MNINNYLIKSRHIFCNSLWMEKLKGASVTLLSSGSHQDEQEEGNHTIEELVDFTLNVQRFNLASTNSNNKNEAEQEEEKETDIRKQPKVLAAGEIDISFRGIEIHYQNTNNTDSNNICKIKYDEIESMAKYSVLRPSSHLRSPYQHFAVLEIKVFVQRKKTSSTQDDNNKNQKLQKLLLIGSSYHSTSLLFDSAMTLWKRQNDIFDSELHRALFKSRPVDEALSIIASMPFEAFGTVTSKSGGVNTLMTKTGFRQPASTIGTDQNRVINNSTSSKNNTLLNDDNNNDSSNQQQQRDVRIEISPDGILQLWLLPKDFHSMKYDDLQFYATTATSNNNNNTKNNNDNNNLPLPPSARYERFPKCVYDLSTLIDCRLTNNSDCAIASSSGGGAGNGEDGVDESVVTSSPIGNNNNKSSSGTTGASSSTSAAAASTLDRINKESSRILAATANEQIQQHFDDLELLSAESIVNSSSDEVKVSENTINSFKKRVSYLFLVFPDSTALTIKMQYQPTLDSGSTAQQHPHLYNPLFSSSRHLTHSSITDIFYACCAARPWLQPALNNHHQLYSVETADTKEEKSSSSIKKNGGTPATSTTNTNSRKINLENLIPGAIQPFTRKEIAQCHDRYNSIQRDIARMCILKVAKSSSSSSTAAAATMMKNSSVSSSSSSFSNNNGGNVMIAQVYNTYPNMIRNGGSSTLDQPPSLGAITLSDIPIIFKHSLIPRNSESSHDVFMRNVLECCFTCCYTNICTQPQLMPEFMRSLNFSDFLFAMYVLERGGVNLRMMMVYGGIVRSFFHRSSSNNNKSLLTAANHQIMLDEIHQQQQDKDESKTKTKNTSSSSTMMSFDLSTFKRVLKTLQSAKTQNIYNQQQQQSQTNNSSSSPYHENNSTFLISATQAAKKVEGDAEILWQCALATYGQDTWENKMPAFAQFLGLIKISHDLQISLLQDFEELLKNSSDGSIVIEKKRRGDDHGVDDHHSPSTITTTTTTIRTNNICPSTNSIAIGPGHPKFFEVLLLYQGIHMSLHSYASSSSSSPSRNSNNNKNIPDYAWDSPAESPRNHGEDYSYSNDYFGESFYNDDDDDDFYSTPSRKNRKSSPSKNSSNNNNIDETKIDKKQIENRLSEKTVYDLSKNKVRNTVLGGESNNNSPSNNNNKQDDYPNNVTSTTKQEQGEASFLSKLVSRLTLQTVYHGTFFTDYAESYFSQLRHEFGVSDQELWNAVALPKVKSSLCFANFSGVHSLLSSGKSKSLLSRSHDGRFIFKELPKHEVAVLRRILPAYLAHIRKYPNNISLLPRYLALYKIAEYRDSHDAYTFIVVIENIFARAERSIDAVYDLKGSLVGRESEKNFLEKGVAAKDHQFVIDPNRGPICLPAKFRDSILRQLFLDVQFLKQLNATDYSLLVGVHTVDHVQDETKYQNRKASSASARGLAQLLGGDDYSVKSGRVRENDDDDDDDDDDENENENENSSSSSSTSSDYYEDENDIDDEIQEATDFHKEMEECPVHRVMNYCQDEISSSGTMMVMRNNFFGGLPAFSQGHYVERVNDEKNRLRLPSGCQWPNESSSENQTDNNNNNSKGRRFNKTNPKFQLSSKLRKNQEEQNQVTSSSSQHQQKLSEIVYIGLVDTLTEYDWRKKAEFVAKGYLLMKDMDNVSCAPASEYASRFLNFMAKDVFVPAVEI